ncbi:hypothetical protein D7024_01140 [Desulfofundulus salinus]|uniref:Uncharacterized protein n=1 Tax=Desulfofundulus salinus TaxID=2419843 RepID=A0A494WWX8_9FIRM|nr:hypothetical protein D7024_01140 [Desulfofundulus salinum]
MSSTLTCGAWGTLSPPRGTPPRGFTSATWRTSAVRVTSAGTSPSTR